MDIGSKVWLKADTDPDDPGYITDKTRDGNDDAPDAGMVLVSWGHPRREGFWEYVEDLTTTPPTT